MTQGIPWKFAINSLHNLIPIFNSLILKVSNIWQLVLSPRIISSLRWIGNASCILETNRTPFKQNTSEKTVLIVYWKGLCYYFKLVFKIIVLNIFLSRDIHPSILLQIDRKELFTLVILCIYVFVFVLFCFVLFFMTWVSNVLNVSPESYYFEKQQ